MKDKYEKWGKDRRFREAVKKVLDEEWSQVAAAEEYGVSRQHLNLKVRQERERREARLVKAREELGVGRLPLVSDESRRVPPYDEFERMYFGHWTCPDCQVRHDVPGFHNEMQQAIRDPANRRVLINLPPYHSKSTNVTVKDTVYDIVQDPNLRTMIISKSLPFSRLFLKSINDILTNEDLYIGAERNLIEDYGPFRPEGQSVWNADQIFVAGRVSAEKDPTVQVLGVGGQVYGRRGDKIKFDDIATLENQRNPDRVLSMLEWIDKEALSRIGKRGIAIWVGTRVAPGDIYYTLGQRPGYKVLRYSAIVDDHTELTLWPEHFPYSQAIMHRSEMSPADFQLVYQNVDIPGLGASFTQEMIDLCKDTSRVLGMFDPKWRLIAGLDLAGGTKDSGYTAFTLLGIDLETGHRYLIDQVAVKSMKAPQIRDQILRWSDQYPIFEWRVENNGLQSQLVQYNAELIQQLARRGVRVTPHTTHKNKWDPQFGVESMAPLMSAGMFHIPWGNAPTAQRMQPFVEELIAFPMGVTSDRVMSCWFSDLGARDLLQRAHLPMFNDRMRVPKRIRRNRGVVDFQAREIRRVPLSRQRRGLLGDDRRSVLGVPVPHGEVQEWDVPEEDETPFNIDPRIWNPGVSGAAQ